MSTQILPPGEETEDVIKYYSNMVYRLACARTGSRYDAEEVYQEVFYRFLKKNPAFESEEHRKAWFLRVTINCSNTLLSSAWRRRTQELPEDLPFTEKEDLELYREIQKLPAKYRDVLHLFYYEELPVAEIAQLLRRKEATVRTHLARARKLLKKALKEADYGF